MVNYCVEFIQRPDGKYDAQPHFGQHFSEDQLLDEREPSAPYEIYQVTGHTMLLPETVLSKDEKIRWLEELQGKVGHDGTRYIWRRAV